MTAPNKSADPVSPVPGAQEKKIVTHTPGPWKVVGPTGYIYTEGDPYRHGQMHVAQVRGWGHLTGKGGGCAFSEKKAIAIQEANARLIAAAPDLLAACQAFLSATAYSREEVTALVLMRAAVVRAEGSPV